MDPAGIREIYCVRPYVDNPYQLELVSRALPFKTRVHATYMNIPWLPLSEPLTQRVSTASEGYAGWLQYDAIVLAGVDLECAAERDVQHLRSALERGLPTLVCGGKFGLGHSYRLWHDLETSLPAAIPATHAVACSGEVVAVGNHPILRGLPSRFGKVRTVHSIRPHSDAQVILEADGLPVLVASERFGGRQLILAVAEADGLCCDALSTDGFYGHPFYGDLMRQCLTWLMAVETPLSFESLELETGLFQEGPEPHVIHAGVRLSGDAPGALLRCSVFAVDEARLASGGDTRRAERLSEFTRPITQSAQRETFLIEDSLAGKCSGVYEVELALEMSDPPRTSPKGCFGMAQPPEWNNWKGNAVCIRRFFLRFADRRGTHVFVPGRTFTLEQSRSWRVQVRPPSPASCRLQVSDSTGAVVGTVSSGAATTHELLWLVPPLVEGDYTAAVLVERPGSQAEEFRFLLKAVAPRPPDDDFHMISHTGSGALNDDETLALMRANLAEFGLDTLSLGILRIAEKVWDKSTCWADEPFSLRRARWLDAMAVSEGFHLWNDFDQSMIILATHGANARYAPTTPCVHDPAYETAVRQALEPRLKLLAERAGLISTEIIDEPHLYASNLCRCETCLRLYRDRFGEEMPQYAETAGDQTARRWHLFQWLEDYTSRAFATTRKVKLEIAPQLHLHNVAIDRLFVSTFMFNGMHRWAAYGDELYMACYPWSYLNWRGGNEMPHSQTHWIAGWIRGLARHYRIPWGVFMELWEHDVPNRCLPPFWSVSQFYSLLAEGVDRLDTFLVCFGIEVFGISFERLREFGREVNKVRPFFPLLPQTSRPRAHMAFVNPWAEWVMNPAPHCLPPGHEGYGYYRRYGYPFDKLYPHENRRMLAYELFHRVFNDLDQVDEQLLCEAPPGYQAIVLSDCIFLMESTMTTLRSFVQSGGVLILDCLPQRNEVGQPADTILCMISGQPLRCELIVPGLSCKVFQCGKGHVVLFSTSLQTAYADAVESGRQGIRERIENGVGQILAQLGLRSRCVSSNGDIDAGIRLGDGLALVALANTSAFQQTARITLAELPFTPQLAVNLTTGTFISCEVNDQCVAFDVKLDAYHGALCALYPSTPQSCRLNLSQHHYRRGDELNYEVRLVSSEHKPAHGTFLVHISVVDGLGRQYRQLGGPLLVKDGHARFNKALPINAPCCSYAVRVEEPLLGLSAHGQFTVEP